MRLTGVLPTCSDAKMINPLSRGNSTALGPGREYKPPPLPLPAQAARTPRPAIKKVNLAAVETFFKTMAPFAINTC